jgi:glucose-1-phosphate adenylyltransferase
MNYDNMLKYHKEKNADATIAVIDVPLEEASRFGIMNTNEDGLIYEFEEKPKNPKSTKASMGIYIFNWKLLKKILKEDQNNRESSNDFGKNIIPKMLEQDMKINAYSFEGYWKDVGTIESLWESNMDLLREDNELNMHDKNWRIYSENHVRPAQYVGPNAEVRNSLAVDGCEIYGEVNNSVLFSGVIIGKNSKIINSVIMPDTKIGDNVIINKAIVGSSVIVRRDCIIGDGKEVTVIGGNQDVKAGSIVARD